MLFMVNDFRVAIFAVFVKNGKIKFLIFTGTTKTDVNFT